MSKNLKIDEFEYTSLFKCTRCGQCTYGQEEAEFTSLCPVHKKGNFFSYSAGGMMQIARNLYEGKIDYSETLKDIVYLCTTCGVCESNCGVIENHLDIIGKIRRELITLDFPESKALAKVVEGIEKFKNPYGHKQEDRTDWLDGRKEVINNSDASVFYYTGCVSAYDQKQVPQALTRIWDHLDIRFSVCDAEQCCGGPLFYSGYEDKARKLAQHNVRMIEESGIKTVVASCPTCAMVFKKYYPEWLKRELPFEVYHSTEHLAGLVAEGRLKPGALKEKSKAIYHDSCHLGRGLGLFEEPRDLMQAIGGLETEEFNLCRENSQCCGGGGMIPIINSAFSFETAYERLDQIDDETVDTLASACPNCRKTLHLAARKKRRKIRVADVCELIADSLA